ncbi:lipopolysaccharide biosynthesis protein [Allorhizocola rhizosphaerae]|uniref:lipopolysaccharide biosynthesis protein n=1 Tax=Allorhizocola rhizosphaerae TaxID=1872709 RepID=UPI0013C365BF|nr:lipopolysaccharide biosynthesis protein [Allorhizocola rhizosphaerae]
MTDVRTPSRSSSVLKSSLLTMLAIAALGVTRLVHLALVGRNVSDATFEMVGLAISATMTAGLFLPGGLASAASKFIAYQEGKGDPDAARAVYRLLSRVGYAVSGVLGAIVGIGLWAYYGVDGLSVGLLTFAFSAYSIEKSAFYGFHRVLPYTRLELAGAVVAIGSTVVVVWLGWTAYLMPLTLGYSVLILGAWVLLRRKGPRKELPMREIAEYVGLASVGGLASAGLLQALPMIAGLLRVDIGAFATAVGLVAPLYFLPRALGMALFPAMAGAHGAGDLASVRKQADLTTRGLFVVLAPLFAAGVLLSRQILVVVFGPAKAGGAIVLQILLAATFLMVTQVAAVNALSSGSAREVRIPVTSSVLGGITGIATAIPLGLTLGEVGVALAYLLAAAVSATGPLVMVARRHELAWLGPISRAVTVVIGAVAAAVVVDRMTASWLVDVVAAVVAAGLAGLLLHGDLRAVLASRHR